MASFLEQIVPTEDEPRPKTKRQLRRLRKLKNLRGPKISETFFQNAGRPCSHKDSTRTTVINWDISHVFFMKNRRKKFNPYLLYFFVKFSRGFIFANYQICNFSRGFNFANCTFRNILRGLNFANFGQILANREIYPTQKLIPLPYFF